MTDYAALAARLRKQTSHPVIHEAAAAIEELQQRVAELEALRCPHTQTSADGIIFCDALNSRVNIEAQALRIAELEAELEVYTRGPNMLGDDE